MTPAREPERVIVVSEIGINHGGSLETAKEMMAAAMGAGADYVKFQKRTVEVVYSAEELASPRESPFGTTNGALKHGLEFGPEEYDAIDAYAREIGIAWYASPWDEESVLFLEHYGVPFLKIASACLTDTGLLRVAKTSGIPVILSTGMSTLEEIDAAVETLGDSLAYLLHCTATYPCALDEINLRCIGTLWERYPGVPVGFSLHSVSPWPALCAAAMGAMMIEAHLTLSHSSFGSDQAASLEPKAFTKLVEEIRTFETTRGDGVKKVYDSEVPIKQKLRRVFTP